MKCRAVHTVIYKSDRGFASAKPGEDFDLEEDKVRGILAFGSVEILKEEVAEKVEEKKPARRARGRKTAKKVETRIDELTGEEVPVTDGPLPGGEF